MKISIITIVYNNREHIASCIESVLGQSYPDVEHLVIDGGSTDGTQAVIEGYADQLGYYKSEPDKGLYNALNKGIKQATGDVIGILHSDDLFYAEDTLAQIAAAFKQSQADLVYANGMYVERDDISRVKRVYRSKPYKKRYLNWGWIPLHTTIYVKKEVFERYGLYDESYRIASDYEISLRWFKASDLKTYFLNTWVVKMRLGGKSTTASLQQRKSAEDLQIIRKFKLASYFTLFSKIGRKIPQYLLPKFKKFS
ncbi:MULTISPECIES: glycosyltransferase family 2 protein [unclassified Leeuwenhoekiella]|uniref:glycosyltransferase family 2 protein n=1 Tax=unclassified Leeuwenhoekiella TaxID=2615029 RepID=UPI000C4A1778|nr:MULTISPECIES: glycosyltransferase family 2 protein [unclassified Leeuwenhoekiella]MAW97086.1 glycosyl transferase [Leeuwenhoekiella sp.]MBA82602.1 glycosyl transferase [Leeuwenhoekiella sp.]